MEKKNEVIEVTAGAEAQKAAEDLKSFNEQCEKTQKYMMFGAYIDTENKVYFRHIKREFPDGDRMKAVQHYLMLVARDMGMSYDTMLRYLSDLGGQRR